MAFGAIGTAAIPHIRAALNDSWADIRLAAIRALGETGDTSMETQEALRKIEADSNRQVRALATATLRNMGTKKRKRK